MFFFFGGWCLILARCAFSASAEYSIFCRRVLWRVRLYPLAMNTTYWNCQNLHQSLLIPFSFKIDTDNLQHGITQPIFQLFCHICSVFCIIIVLVIVSIFFYKLLLYRCIIWWLLWEVFLAYNVNGLLDNNDDHNTVFKEEYMRFY